MRRRATRLAAVFTSHHHNDDMSLRLTQAALLVLRAQPALMNAVLGTLDRWDRVAPVDSKPLRDQWRHLLLNGDWQLALDTGPLGQQLRQASPLSKAMPTRQRLDIIRACRGRSSST